MRDVVYRTDDVLDYEMPLLIMTAKSEIHGFGMFLMSEASQNDVLFSATINGERTQAGRFINHAIEANTRLVIGRFANYTASNRTIKSGEELTLNYRDNHQQLSG